MNFYVSLFKNSKVNNVSRGPDGKTFTVSFELDGQEFMALNAGPQFKFNESIAMFVNCEDQAEVDYFWNKLTADGGEESMCSWCKDKYGLWWQIVPKQLGDYIGGPDPVKARRGMQAMLQMNPLEKLQFINLMMYEKDKRLIRILRMILIITSFHFIYFLELRIGKETI